MMARFNDGKKKSNMAVPIIVMCIFAFLSVFAGIYFSQNKNKNEKRENDSAKEGVSSDFYENKGEMSDEEKIGSDDEKPNESRISFVAVGDNIVHSSVMSDAEDKAEGTDKKYDFLPMYENVSDVIKNADLAYINQEAPIAGEDNRGYSGYPMFNSPEQVGYDIKQLGFDIVNLANNHMLDRYTQGYKSTIDFWREMDGITYIGGFEDEEDYNNIRVVEKDGIKIAFLSYTYGTNGVNLDSSSDMVIPLCDASSNDEIDRQSALARKIADIVIVCMHWGNENTSVVTALQEQQMQILVNNGVDVILGSHPHVLQPMLWKERPDGKNTLVIYSLGNFLSGMEYMKNHIGGIVSFDIVKNENGTFVENVSFIPTVCQFDKNVRNFKIYRFSEYTDELLKSHGTQVRGTDSPRTMEYLENIITENIDAEFLTEPFYKNITDDSTT